MKQRMLWALAAAALLPALLGGCAKVPDRTADGRTWGEDWTLVGTVLGVEPPAEPWQELDNKAALAGSGLYYAAWTAGEGEDYVNAEDETVDLYPAQISLVLQEGENTQALQAEADGWKERAEGQNTILETGEETVNQQTYDILCFDYPAPDNPYERGAAAFGVGPGGAVCIEVSCRETFDGDPAEILLDFLEGCHFSGGEEGAE